MENIKYLIQGVIQDLADDKPIKSILLKSKVIASKLQNKNFESWIDKESLGYDDAKQLPEYRILNAALKVDVFKPFQGIFINNLIPTDMFKDDLICNLLSHARITDSLYQIETMCKDEKGDRIIVSCPSIAYAYVKQYINGSIHKLYQDLSVASYKNIISVFQMKLLNFFLDVEKSIEGGLDFSSMISQEKINQIMEIHQINAVVANVGSGTINTGNISSCNVATQTVNESNKAEILRLITELEKIIPPIQNNDLNEALVNIKSECQKPFWGIKAIKLGCNALKGICTDVAIGVATSQIKLIAQNILDLLN